MLQTTFAEVHVAAGGVPVVLIHGLWIHSTSWTPWIELLHTAGYRPTAPGWPGDGETVAETRARPDRLAGVGLEDIAARYGDIIDGLEQPPVVIGHSIGALVAQKLNMTHSLRAVVAIDPAPVKGVLTLPPAQLRSSFPVLRNPGNARRTVALSAEQFRYAFGNAIPAGESDALCERYSIPGPGRPIFEVATANFRRRSAAAVDTRTGDRAPLLVVAGELDHTVPAAVARATHRQYRRSPAPADLIEVAGAGHSLVFDHAWTEVAHQVLSWLNRHVCEPAITISPSLPPTKGDDSS